MSGDVKSWRATYTTKELVDYLECVGWVVTADQVSVWSDGDVQIDLYDDLPAAPELAYLAETMHATQCEAIAFDEGVSVFLSWYAPQT